MAWDFFLGKVCWSSGSAGVGQEMVRECPPRLGLFVWVGWCLSLIVLLSSLFFCGAKCRKQVCLPNVSKG